MTSTAANRPSGKVYPIRPAADACKSTPSDLRRLIVETIREESTFRAPTAQPLYDVDAEWSLVAAVLDGVAPAEALPVSPAHFQAPAPRAAFHALLDGATTDLEVAAALLGEGFSRRATDDLASWAANAPVIGRAELNSRALRIAELWRRRRLVEACRAIADAMCCGHSFADGVQALRDTVREVRP